MKKSNAIVNSKHKISLKDVKFDVPQIGKETEDLQLKSLHELVEKTVKSELDII